MSEGAVNAVITCAVMLFLGAAVVSARGCIEAEGVKRADDNATSVKLANERPAIIEACKTACGERGVHKASDHECECK